MRLGPKFEGGIKENFSVGSLYKDLMGLFLASKELFQIPLSCEQYENVTFLSG